MTILLTVLEAEVMKTTIVVKYTCNYQLKQLKRMNLKKMRLKQNQFTFWIEISKLTEGSPLILHGFHQLQDLITISHPRFYCSCIVTKLQTWQQFRTPARKRPAAENHVSFA